MNDIPSPRGGPDTPGASVGARARGRHHRSLILLFAVIFVALAAGRCGAGDGSGGDARAPRMALRAEDLAAAQPAGARRAADFQRVPPPVDLIHVERAARGASMGRIEMPASRSLDSWRDAVTGAQISQALLVFDDEQAAARIDGLAAPLLSNAFQLISEPLAMQGVEDGRLWSSAGYAAASFRVGGVLSFVGSDRPDDLEGLLRLAEAARDRIAAAASQASETARAGTATSSAP